MEHILKPVIESPPVLLLLLGLVLLLLAVLGRSPLPSAPFKLGPIQRVIFAAIGLLLATPGFMHLLPKPERFAISGNVLEKVGGAPVTEAKVEAHDDATTDKPSKVAYTDDRGTFYLNYVKDDEGRYVRLKVYKDDFAVSTLYAQITPRPVTLTFHLVRAGRAGAPDARGEGVTSALGSSLMTTSSTR
jgi:hypothetical protein